MPTSHKMLGAILFSVVLAAAPSYAQEGSAEETHAGAAAEAGEEHGIINWWSWDYGANAKDPSHKGWPPPFGFALVNFGLFLAVLYRLAGKPLMSFVRERHDRIAHDLNEAAKLRKAAEAELAEYQRKVAGAEQEVETLLTQIRKEAEADKQRIIAAAEAQALRLKEDAERQVEAEIARARAELRKEVVEAAVRAAEQTLKAAVGGEDQRKMAERYVGDLESLSRAGRA